MSKAFALAAVRIGFLIAAAEVIALIGKLIAAYPIPDPSARIALNALSDEGIAYMQEQRDSILALRKDFQTRLQQLPCITKVYDSAANFLLAEFVDSDAAFSLLKEKGIILRDQHHVRGLANHLRITIGDENEMENLIAKLSQLS
jgi:histidinol-phosphate aminotransferase